MENASVAKNTCNVTALLSANVMTLEIIGPTHGDTQHAKRATDRHTAPQAAARRLWLRVLVTEPMARALTRSNAACSAGISNLKPNASSNPAEISRCASPEIPSTATKPLRDSVNAVKDATKPVMML